MLPLRVRALARQELEAAFDWYHERSPSAAEGFLDAVDAAFMHITHAPKQPLVVSGMLRRVLLSGYPYAVYYKQYPNVIRRGGRHPRPPSPANMASARLSANVRCC